MREKSSRGISSDVLRNIAIFSMICDHIGYELIEQGILRGYDLSLDIIGLLADPTTRKFVFLDTLMRGIGRIGYPIFAYLIVVSFQHTKNIFKFLRRICIFAVLTEVPFDLFWSGDIINFEHQNVLFTYIFGLLAILAIDRLWKKSLIYKGISIGGVACCIGAGYIFHVDYDFVGVLVIVIYYCLRTFPLYRDIGVVAALTLQYIFDGLSFLGMIIIRKCNGIYHKPQKFRYFFYWFYPAHMLILTAINNIIW